MRRIAMPAAKPFGSVTRIHRKLQGKNKKFSAAKGTNRKRIFRVLGFAAAALACALISSQMLAQSPPPASFVTAKMFQVGGGYGDPNAYYGTEPYDLAVGDFNNDGKLDIIAACWSAEVTVNLGNGDGTFQSRNHVYALSHAQAVAVGDFNGDGNLDAAVLASGNPGSVAIFLGDGTGNLTQVGSYPVGNQGSGTSNIAVGKLHGGGNLDLVVTNSNDNTVSVLLGNGDGTFQPQVAYSTTGSYPFNTFPQWVAIADVNKDGYLDLVTADAGNAGGGGISVLLGNGNGTFQAPVFYSDVLNNSGVGVEANGVAIADLNGDGNLDVVTAAWTWNNVNVFLGNGDGTFKPAVGYPVPNAQTIAIADLNGKQDLIVADYAESTTWVLLGNGDGTFEPGVAYATDEGDQGLVVADFNGDGNLDFAVGNDYGPFMTVALGNGDGTFRAGRNYALGVGAGVNIIAAADLRNDGNLDIVEADPYSHALHVMLGSPHGVLGAPSTIPVCLTPWWVAVGDVNGDGKPDLVAIAGGNSGCGVADNSVAVLLGNGDGTFQAPVYYSIGNNTTNNAAGAVVALAALTANPSLDIVVSNNDGSLSVLLNQGGGIFGAATVIAGVTGTAEYILTGDFNGDGKLDLALPDYINNTVKILLGNGDGTFQAPASVPNVPSGPAGLAVGDFNKDGKLDLAVTAGSIDGGGVAVLLGNGDGTFTFSADYIWSAQITGTNPSALAAADVNGDGNLDLLIPLGVTRAGYPYPNTNGLEGGNLGMVVLLGNGDGTFVEDSAGPFLVGSDSTQVVAGDFNNDGATDAAVLQHWGAPWPAPFVTMLINNTLPVSVSPLIVNYGTMTVGASKAETVILTNNQSTLLAISSITLGGTDPGDFSTESNCGSSLLPGADCTITVTATPTAAGAQTATLLINDGVGTQTAQLVITVPQAAAPTFSEGTGTYTGTQSITMSTTAGTVICYNTSGTAMTVGSGCTGGTQYTGTVVAVSSSETLYAVAGGPGYTQSSVASATYTINTQATAPTFSEGTGTYTGTQSITMSTTEGTVICYNTSGAAMTVGSGCTGGTQYTGTAVAVSSSETLYAVAGGPGYTQSSVASAVYTINFYFTLTLTELGNGTGTVTDNTTQINCSEANGIRTPSSTCSGTYLTGTPVVLTESIAGSPTGTAFGGWGGVCAASGTGATCSLTASVPSALNATANFIAPPIQVTLASFATPGTNVSGQATFACPNNPNPTPEKPCTDPNGHALEVMIPQVTTGMNVVVTETEFLADGLCRASQISLGGKSTDFDCRLVNFYNYGLDGNGNAIVPLCYPYANGNCVSYRLSQPDGSELPAGDYSGGIFWKNTFNNDTYTPTGNWLGSTPRMLDDPGADEVPPLPYGTSCSTAMQTDNPTLYPGPYYCQFDNDITTFYNAAEPVDSGIGGKTSQPNDVVIAFLPTSTGTGNHQTPPSNSAPTFTSNTSAPFLLGTYGFFAVTVTGYPAPVLSLTNGTPCTALTGPIAVAPGVTIDCSSGLISGAPTAGGSYPIGLTATNIAGSVPQSFTLVVNIQAAAPSFSEGTGTYAGTQSITMSTTAGTVICYNTSGTAMTVGSGCTGGTQYTGSAVAVSSSETLSRLPVAPASRKAPWRAQPTRSRRPR